MVVGVPKGAVTVLPPELDERWSFARAFSVTPATVGGCSLTISPVFGTAENLCSTSSRTRPCSRLPTADTIRLGAVYAFRK